MALDKKVDHPDEACLRMASLITEELLPQSPPTVEGAEIAGWTVYSHTLGGDFFDYHDFSGVCCQAETKMRIVVGDACGHGFCSALLMTSTRSYLRARAMQSGTLAQVVTDVNRLLCMDIRTSGHFVTLFYASIDTQERKIEWVRAGHPPAMLFDPRNEEIVTLNGRGVSLGVDPHHSYEMNSLANLADGTVILIGSDGLWELVGDSAKRRQLSDLVLRHRHENAAALAEAVKDIMYRKRGATLLQDDATLIVVKFC